MDDIDLTTTNPEPPRKSLLKRLLVLLSIIFVLFICVVTIVFVIPRTNIYRLEDKFYEKIHQYIPGR